MASKRELEWRIDALEDKIDGTGRHRRDGLESRIDELEEKIDKLEGKLEGKIDELEGKIYELEELCGSGITHRSSRRR